jgi:hypothetical protein
MQALFKERRLSDGLVRGAVASLGDQRTLEFLALSIDVPWPVSIVISSWSRLGYQFCFKHLTLCKVCFAAI